MELISHVLIVVGILLFCYNLVKMQTYKNPPTGQKGNNNFPKGNSIEKPTVRTHSKSKFDNYRKYVAIKSKKIPNGESVGLDAGEILFLMRNSKDLNVKIDEDGSIYYCSN